MDNGIRLSAISTKHLRQQGRKENTVSDRRYVTCRAAVLIVCFAFACIVAITTVASVHTATPPRVHPPADVAKVLDGMNKSVALVASGVGNMLSRTALPGPHPKALPTSNVSSTYVQYVREGELCASIVHAVQACHTVYKVIVSELRERPTSSWILELVPQDYRSPRTLPQLQGYINEYNDCAFTHLGQGPELNDESCANRGLYIHFRCAHNQCTPTPSVRCVQSMRYRSLRTFSEWSILCNID